jgi:type II secretory pathway component GspD/PulD (secretin)
MALDAFAYFDIPEPQVYVEAKIIEITYESNFEFGLASFLDRNQGGPNTFWRGESISLQAPSVLTEQQPGSLPFQGVELGFGLVGKMAEKYGALDLTIQAMQRNGTAEVLSKPSIVATQGQPASVKTGQRIPVLQVNTANITGTIEAVTSGNSTVDTKIELAVLPKFIGDGFVTLDLRPTVQGVTGFSQGPGGTSAPIISTREASTVVTMADGETLIVGGLYTNSTVSDKAKIPLLADIPGLGKLFQRTKDQRVKTELVFFVTPHILRKRSDFRVIAPPGEAERLGEPCTPGATPAGAGSGR